MLIQALKELPVGVEIIRQVNLKDVGSLTPVLVNEAACEAAGSDLKADLGKSWRETSPELADSDFAKQFAQCLSSGEPIQWEVEYGDSRFDKNWFRGSGRRLDAQTLVIAFENVTERKRGELRLAESNRALDEFASVASHDLKGPIRDIHNLGSWIEEDAGESLPEESRQHSHTLLARAKRMERLLDDLLAYSRAGVPSATAEPFTVQELLDSICELSPIPDGFTLNVRGGTTAMRAPRPPLEQVLRNLIANAVRHHDRESGTIDVEVEERGGRVAFTVRDDGPGIEESQQAKVFEMFRVGRGKSAGHGLGLALVQRAVKAHGGEIAVHSRPGEGCEFRFSWPTAQ